MISRPSSALAKKINAFTPPLRGQSVRHSGHGQPDPWFNPEKCNGREVVGWGLKGMENYQDRIDFWYPAIRFRKNDELITPIRMKELADWKDLSLEEKKLLYRYSFQQTLAEFEAPNGYWKVSYAIFFCVFSLCIFYVTFLKAYVYPPIPPTFDNEYKEGIVERQIVMEKGRPLIGPARFYDYENNRWKD